MGLTARDALDNWPVSAIIQMLHALSAGQGVELEWVEAGEPSQDLLLEFEKLSTKTLNI